MADQTLPTVAVTPFTASADPVVAENPQRQAAVKAYLGAKTKEDRAAVVKQYPFLSEIFASVNHE